MIVVGNNPKKRPVLSLEIFGSLASKVAKCTAQYVQFKSRVYLAKIYSILKQSFDCHCVPKIVGNTAKDLNASLEYHCKADTREPGYEPLIFGWKPKRKRDENDDPNIPPTTLGTRSGVKGCCCKQTQNGLL